MQYYTSGAINVLDGLLPKELRDQTWVSNWRAFQVEADRRLLMYQDDWETLLIEYISERLDESTREHFFPAGKGTPRWPITTQFNMLKRVVNETSLIYLSAASRNFVIENETEPLPSTKPTDPTAPPTPPGFADSAEPAPKPPVADPKAPAIPPVAPMGAAPPNPMEPLPPDEPIEAEFINDERFSEIVGGLYNARMLKVNELVNVVNCVLVRPIADPECKTGFDFHILTPDMFIPIQDPDYPNRLVGVLYSVDCSDSIGGATPTRKQYVFFKGWRDYPPFYAEMDNYDLKSVKEEDKQPYPYVYDGKPYLPFACFQKSVPITGEFIDRTTGNDLYKATLKIAFLITFWERCFGANSFKQMAVTGTHGADEVPTRFIRDFMSVMEFPGAADQMNVTLLDFQTNLESMWKALLSYIELFISNYGMGIDKFKSTPVSGVSLKVQNQSLINIIKKQWELYRHGEEQLGEIIRAMNNTMLPSGEFAKIDDDATFEIDFGALPFDEDPLELTDQWLKLADKGIMSLAEILLKLNPDVGTIEDAQEQIRLNKELNKQAMPAIQMIPGAMAIPQNPAKAGATAPNPFLQNKEGEGNQPNPFQTK